MEIQGRIASAWVLRAEGRQTEALSALRAAADAEDETEKSIVAPGPLALARELYGAMLLERGRAREALAAFEAALVEEPNRYNGFAGAATAAEALGDAVEARRITSGCWRWPAAATPSGPSWRKRVDFSDAVTAAILAGGQNDGNAQR